MRDCSTTCGDGTRTKTRSKTVTEQHNGRCEGSPSVNENCNERPCPSMSLNQILNDFIANSTRGIKYVTNFMLMFSKLRMGQLGDRFVFQELRGRKKDENSE